MKCTIQNKTEQNITLHYSTSQNITVQETICKTLHIPIPTGHYITSQDSTKHYKTTFLLIKRGTKND